MKYIASCSFGKDSIAMIIERMERGEPIDEIVYCKTMKRYSRKGVSYGNVFQLENHFNEGGV